MDPFLVPSLPVDGLQARKDACQGVQGPGCLEVVFAALLPALPASFHVLFKYGRPIALASMSRF